LENFSIDRPDSFVASHPCENDRPNAHQEVTSLISVVIPVLNERHGLPLVLDALAAQRDAPEFEVLVVDNGSSDGTPEAAARHPLPVTVLHESTRGPYAARNTGLAAASGEIVVLTDADCRPEPSWLAAGVRSIEAGADLVGGAIVQEGSDHPSVWERYDRATYLRQDRFVADQGFAATANLFVKAAVLTEVGPFRPELVASGDLEFCWRARDAGFRLVYAADAVVRHQPRTTMRATWALHRKLGSGFAELARAGRRGPARRDEALRIPLRDVTYLVSCDGPYVPRRRLAPVHAVAMGARWAGRLTGRG
jgi:glycosyltransferase involved in cell wall biosynthesis